MWINSCWYVITVSIDSRYPWSKHFSGVRNSWNYCGGSFSSWKRRRKPSSHWHWTSSVRGDNFVTIDSFLTVCAIRWCQLRSIHRQACWLWLRCYPLFLRSLICSQFCRRYWVRSRRHGSTQTSRDRFTTVFLGQCRRYLDVWVDSIILPNWLIWSILNRYMRCSQDQLYLNIGRRWNLGLVLTHICFNKL